jgi:hypothetical protein
MISHILSLGVLAAGCFLYARVVEKVFGPYNREIPAFSSGSMDCVPLPTLEDYLAQLLNISGTD